MEAAEVAWALQIVESAEAGGAAHLQKTRAISKASESERAKSSCLKPNCVRALSRVRYTERLSRVDTLPLSPEATRSCIARHT